MIFFVLFIISGVGADGNKGRCRLEPHSSVEYLCLVAGGEGFKQCNNYEPIGTIVNPRCRPNYYSPTDLPFMHCLNGKWDHIVKCVPDCGRLTPDGMQLVVGGKSVKRGELPWQAGIYSKSFNPYMQICGGSLISTNVIISAAHCFWSDLEKQLPASQFAVAVGKLYRPWNNSVDEAQTSDVRLIHLPSRFLGTSTNFQDDIAVIIAAHKFQLKPYIRPVCLSFDHRFEKQQLYFGNKGKVAGWGLSAEDGNASPVLQVVNLPYVDSNTCILHSPPSFQQFITSDKICAGSLESNTALCKGDSGGGLAFPETFRQVERYYLRGIASTAPTSDQNHKCNIYTYTSFTSIVKHEHFIKQFWIESGEFKCEDGSTIPAASHCDGTKDCADGSDESDELCRPSASTQTTRDTFKCEDGTVITLANLCDGFNDCADGSDETDSECSSKSCSSAQFRCSYGACVSKEAKCNTVQDCRDGSDEFTQLCASTAPVVFNKHTPESAKEPIKVLVGLFDHIWRDTPINN